MKNLLLLCPVYSPYSGGGAQYFTLLTKFLNKNASIRKIIVLTEFNKFQNLIEKNKNLIILRLLIKRDNISKNLLYSVISYLITYVQLFILIPTITIFFNIKVFIFTRYLSLFLSLLTKLLQIFKVKIILDMRTQVPEKVKLILFKHVNFILANSLSVFNQLKRLNMMRKTFLIENPIEFPNINNLKNINHLKMKYPKLIFKGYQGK